MLYQVITTVLPRFLLVPPQLWQDKILKVINYPKPIYLSVGAKRSSFRRRLITASVQPSFYTNYVNNKLKLQPTDAENKDDFFMSAMKRRAPEDRARKLIYGFFHPYANNGGGGEKVLWQAVQATLLEDQRNIVAVYTVNTDAEPLQILQKAQEKFDVLGIDSKRVVFIYLHKYAKYIDGDYWKHFTLLGQLFGSALLGWEAMYELSPDVWIDTQGLPGSYWLVSWALKIPIVAYVHYPIIQPDMFNKLKFQTFGDLRKMSFSARDLKQAAKFLYWVLLSYLYTYLGSMVDLTLANGTWTYSHIKRIWSFNQMKNHPVEILFPPCSTEKFDEVPQISTAEQAAENVKTTQGRDNSLIYVSQFRPEKRHSIVLEQYNEFLAKYRAAKLPLSDLPSLTFLGSCRTPTDLFTLEHLQKKVKELDLGDHVKFIVDCSFEDVKKHLSRAKFGLNAMWNEHFGIGVVEYLSAGVVPIVHASAGPLLDILSKDTPSEGWENEVGFFFKCSEDPDFSGAVKDGELEYISGDKVAKYPTLAELLSRIFIKKPELSTDSKLALKRLLARELLREKFSNKIFATKWMEYLRAVSALERTYREDKRDKIDGVY